MFRRRAKYNDDDDDAAGTVTPISSKLYSKNDKEDSMCSPMNWLLSALLFIVVVYSLTLVHDPEQEASLRSKTASSKAAAPKPATPTAIVGQFKAIQLSGLDGFTAGKTNIAKGKTAMQSTTYTKEAGKDAMSAVDGDRNKEFTHTNGDCNPWWQVDLGGSFNIESVVVFNRQDCCQERLNNIYVEVLDLSPKNTWDITGSMKFSGTLGPIGFGKYDSAVKGKIVRIRMESCEVLSLGQVEVHGTPA